MRFSSWRMLPGQGYFLIAASACGVKPCTCELELLGVLREERLRDDEHVVAALAQRRQAEVHDVEAVVEIFAEASAADLVFEDAVGRGDDADVDLLRLAVADAEDDALLQRAEELHLEVERQLADLVEEERALVGDLELARARRDGAGERALHVAEELALDQVLRDGAAVDDDERPVRARSIGDGSRAR